MAKKAKRFRSAVTGRMVSAKKAKRNPSTTVGERVRPKARSAIGDGIALQPSAGLLSELAVIADVSCRANGDCTDEMLDWLDRMRRLGRLA